MCHVSHKGRVEGQSFLRVSSVASVRAVSHTPLMADADKAAAAARGRAKLEEFRRKKAAKGAAAVVQDTAAPVEPAPPAEQPLLDAGAASPEHDTPVLLNGTHEAEASALGGKELSLPEVSASSAVASAYAQLSASYYDDVIDDVPFPQAPGPPFARSLGGPPVQEQQHASPDVLRGRSVLSWLDAPTDRAPGLATPEAVAPPERGAGGGAVAAPVEAVNHHNPVDAGRSSYTMHAAASMHDADIRAGLFTAPRMDPWPSQAQEAPYPAPSRHDALVAHIEELTRDKLALQRQLDTALGVTAAASSDHDDLVARFNAQAAKLEAAHAALEYAMSAADAAVAAAADAEREQDVARAAQQVALSRCGALAADAIALEERLVQCRRREVRATSKLGRERARAQEAVARAKALGAVAMRLSVQKRRLMRRLRALASEREMAGLPRLPAGFFSLADGQESDGEEDEGDAYVAALARTSYDTGSDGDNEDDENGERDVGPHTPAAAHAGRPPEEEADTPGSNQVPPNTPALLNGHITHADVGLEAADGATRDALARIHALLGELEQRQQQQLAGLRTPGTGVRDGGDVAELAAANAALSRRLAKAQRRLEEAGLASDSESDSDTGSDEGGRTDPSPVYNRASVPAGAGWLLGARRRESLAALAAASVTPTKVTTGE